MSETDKSNLRIAVDLTKEWRQHNDFEVYIESVRVQSRCLHCILFFDLLSSTSCFIICIKTWYGTLHDAEWLHYKYGRYSGSQFKVYLIGLCILYIALALVIILRCVGPMLDLWFQSSQVPRPTIGPGSLTSPRVVIMRLKKKDFL